MGIYEDHVLSRFTVWACGSNRIRPARDLIASGLSGTVVEIGFGAGLNLESYPSAVSCVHAVEPSLGARRLAVSRIAKAKVPVVFAGLEAERIDLDDQSCDGALCTFTLCTIPDVRAALLELRRVLRPGGRFHFFEHGLAPDVSVARWQSRLEPMQKVLCGGCHLTRDPVSLARGAGFEVEVIDQMYGDPRTKPWSFMSFGRAVNPS